MRANGIVGAKRRGKPWRTTKADPQALRRPDLVQRDFSASRPNELWVADLSYLRCWQGLVYFAFVIDAYSRMIVGRDAIATSLMTLPEQLRRSLVWDQGAEMAQHAQLRIDTGLHVYFCDPQSPWQRGSNENTNGLLRQYFPRGTDLSRHGADDLTAVAAALNSRPRKTLDWRTPAEALNEYLQSSQQTGVATTG